MVAASESYSGSGTHLIERAGLSGLGIEKVEMIVSRSIRLQTICRSVQWIGDMDTILRACGAGYSLDGSGLERCESVLFLNRGGVGLRLNHGRFGLRLNHGRIGLRLNHGRFGLRLKHGRIGLRPNRGA